MKDIDKVELLDPNWKWYEAVPGEADWTTEWIGTWKEFVDANAEENDGSMDAEELLQVAETLDRGETYMFGGGASSISFMRKMAGTELESVGTYLRADGMTYPLLAGGGYDDDEGGAHHIRDVDPDYEGHEWWQALSADDRTTVEAVLAKLEVA